MLVLPNFVELLLFELIFLNNIIFCTKTADIEEADVDYVKIWLAGVYLPYLRIIAEAQILIGIKNSCILIQLTPTFMQNISLQQKLKKIEQFALPDLVKSCKRRTTQLSSHGSINASFVSARKMVTLMTEHIRLI